MILHLVSSASALTTTQAELIQRSDGLVLLGDGVLCLFNITNEQLAQLSRSTRLYVLKDDITARGLSHQADRLSTMPTPPQIITYTEFVELTLQYTKTLSW